MPATSTLDPRSLASGQGELVDPAGGHRQVPVDEERLHRRTEAHAGSMREAGERAHLLVSVIAHSGGAMAIISALIGLIFVQRRDVV